MSEQPSRRRVLAAAPAFLALGAGCSSDSGADGTATPDSTTPEQSTRSVAETTVEPGPSTQEGCGGVIEPASSGGAPELWHTRSGSERRMLDESVAAFNEASGHSVEPALIPGSFTAKLQTDIQRNDGPHLFEWAHNLAGSYDESGFLSDQRDEIRVDPCQYVDMAWEAANYDGKTIGLPWAAETVALVYNEAVVESPPETLAEMQAIMDEYHDPEAGQYGLTIPVNPYYLSGFAQAYGEAIYDGESDALGVASEDVERGLRVFFDELRPYMPSDPETTDQQSTFTEGAAAFTIDGPWQLSEIRDSGIHVGVTTLPDLPDSGTPRPYTGVELVYFGKVMDEESRDAVAAREYAEWYTTNRDRLRQLANRANFSPVHADLVGDPALDEDVRVFTRQIQAGYPIPANPKMNNVWAPFGDALRNAFENPDSLSAELDAAAAEIRSDWE